MHDMRPKFSIIDLDDRFGACWSFPRGGGCMMRFQTEKDCITMDSIVQASFDQGTLAGKRQLAEEIVSDLKDGNLL